MESDKISTKLPSDQDLTVIKLEPDDVHESMVDISEQIENKSDDSELSQNVDNFGENVAGS